MKYLIFNYDCIMLHCTELFIITLSSSQYDLYNVDMGHKTPNHYHDEMSNPVFWGEK